MIWNSKKIKKEDKMIKHYLTVFLISMVPIAELRAAIPYSQAVGLPLIPSYSTSYLFICKKGTRNRKQYAKYNR